MGTICTIGRASSFPLRCAATNERQCRDGHNDLLWFINRANLEKPTSPATSVRTAARIDAHILDSDQPARSLDLEDSPDGRTRPARFGFITDFEDLFYMVWHKIKTVYQELQLRYMSRFIALDDVVHYRGTSLKEVAPLTVADLITMLQMWWAEVTDPSLMATLHTHLRNRVVLPNLVPRGGLHNESMDIDDHLKSSLRDRRRIRYAPAPGLRELTVESPVTVIDQVYKRHGIMLDCERDVENEDQSARAMRRAEMKALLRRTPSVTDFKGKDYAEAQRDCLRCTCDETCACKDLCTVEPDEGCLCAMKTDFYIAYEADRVADESLERDCGRSVGEHYLFGASSNEAAQMIVATAALSKCPSNARSMAKMARNLDSRLRQMDHEYIKHLDKPLPSPPGMGIDGKTVSKSPQSSTCLPLGGRYTRNSSAGKEAAAGYSPGRRFGGSPNKPKSSSLSCF